MEAAKPGRLAQIHLKSGMERRVAADREVDYDDEGIDDKMKQAVWRTRGGKGEGTGEGSGGVTYLRARKGKAS